MAPAGIASPGWRSSRPAGSSFLHLFTFIFIFLLSLILQNPGVRKCKNTTLEDSFSLFALPLAASADALARSPDQLVLANERPLPGVDAVFALASGDVLAAERVGSLAAPPTYDQARLVVNLQNY